MKVKKMLCLALCAGMLLSLAACSNGNGSEETSTPGSQVTESGASPSGSITTVTTLADELGYAYLADYAKIPYDIDYVSSIYYQDERVYMLTEKYDDGVSTNRLISMLSDGSDVREHVIPDVGKYGSVGSLTTAPDGSMYFFVYESYEKNTNTDFVSLLDVFAGGGVDLSTADAEEPAAEDGLSPEWQEENGEIVEEGSQEQTGDDSLETVGDTGDIAEDEAADDVLGDSDYRQNYLLLKCDADGNIVAIIDVEDIVPSESEYYYVRSLSCDQNGNVYFTINDFGNAAVYVLDETLNFLFSVGELGHYIDSISPYGETVVVSYWGGGDEGVAIINFETRQAETIQIPSGRSRYYNDKIAGLDGYIYAYDDLYLYKVDQQTNEVNAILCWIDADINSNNLNKIVIVSDSLMLTYYHDYTLGTSELMTIRQVDPSEIPERTLISYACVNLDYNVQEAIVSFNRTNEVYRITIKDYSKYSTDEDWQAGYTQLNNDLLAGEIPDIFSMSNLNINTYSSKGLLEDLYGYIDSDPELTREYFTDGFLNSLEDSNGKLYQMGYAFNLQTLLGVTSVVGESEGWTFDEMMAAYQSMSEDAQLMQWMTKESFISTFLTASIGSFVNYETGECSFNSDEFISLLEMANTFPADFSDYYSEDENTPDFELLKQGKLMLLTTYLYGFDTDFYNAVFDEGELTFKGYPSSSGSGHKLGVNGALAVCASSSNKDGAWEFIKFMIGDDYQSNLRWYFPVQKAAFEARMQVAIDDRYYTDEDGNEVLNVGDWGYNDLEYEVPPLTETQIQHIKDMIATTDSLDTYASDDTIMEIVNDEVQAFYNGQKTVQEVANLIQSRVSTYVLESM